MNIFIFPTNTCFWIACPISEIESYKKIYEIKSREKSKALAILVDDYKYLELNTKLNDNQINFLLNYENPFTILIDKEKILDKELLNQINKLSNSEIYEKIAFRIAHNFMQKKLNRLYWPLFLTSANKSNNPEIFDSKIVRNEFKSEIEKYSIKVFAHPDYCINSKQNSSDIFEFIWESLEIKYLRKN